MVQQLPKIIKKSSLEVNKLHKTREVRKRKDVVDFEIKRVNLIRKVLLIEVSPFDIYSNFWFLIH